MAKLVPETSAGAPLPGAWAYASGSAAAPAGSAVIADSGALAAGTYDVLVEMACQDTTAVGHGMIVEHRNAANAATLKSLGGCSAPDSHTVLVARVVIALNERIRVIAGPAAGTASSQYVALVAVRAS